MSASRQHTWKIIYAHLCKAFKVPHVFAALTVKDICSAVSFGKISSGARFDKLLEVVCSFCVDFRCMVTLAMLPGDFPVFLGYFGGSRGFVIWSSVFS